MTSCCSPNGFDDFFTPRMAKRAAGRYRKKGIDETARRILSFLESQGIEGATVLEVGGGVGELQIELLKRGAARTLNLELSAGYEKEATQLLREAGLEGRAERRLHDIAADPRGVATADVVVLNRVVCCYPDYERLLGTAADHAHRVIVFSYPRRNVFSRLLLGAENLYLSLRGKAFRAYVHPPARMMAVVAARGLVQKHSYRPILWQIAGFARHD